MIVQRKLYLLKIKINYFLRHFSIYRAITELTEIATVLQKVQQAPIPQAKPSRKRPQILRFNSQYSARATTQKPSSTSPTTFSETTYVITKSYNTSPRTAAKYTNKKTVAITVPFLRGTYVTPQGEVYSTSPPLTADKYVTNIRTGTPLVSEIYNIPQTITAQDFVNRCKYFYLFFAYLF